MTAIENPYFDEVAGGVTVGTCRGTYSAHGVEVLRHREELVQEYSWAIPNLEAIETIAEYGPIVEVGAGTGYWAWCLDQLDVVVAATDADPPKPVDQHRHVASWDARSRVYSMNVQEPDATLLLVWPPLDDPMAADVLEAYTGDVFLYVGEGRGGCTADERFHELLFAEWELDRTVAIPTYLGRSDRLEVWVR